MFKDLKSWANSLKDHVYALYLASREERVSFLAKFIIVLVVAYALSPIDLIPDFIPVIGLLDDLILLPLGIWLAIHLMPRGVWLECMEKAKLYRMEMPRNRRAAMVIIMIWVSSLLLLMMWWFKAYP